MAKEESVYVEGDKLIFPVSLDYVSVKGDVLIIDKKPVRGDFIPAAKKGVKNGKATK